ncbi:MAG: PDGLE domain-containing protein [Candidatus ainarchaeum sp.]|nr:PDGLE domain-containing protein [Candidatus ainarchaeum sp.]
MKKFMLFVLAVTVLASFLASSSPDGLEKVAEKLEFIEMASDRASVMPDYTVPLLPEGGISTAFAGIAGVLVTLSVFWTAAFWFKLRSRARSQH